HVVDAGDLGELVTVAGVDGDHRVEIAAGRVDRDGIPGAQDRVPQGVSHLVADPRRARRVRHLRFQHRAPVRGIEARTGLDTHGAVGRVVDRRLAAGLRTSRLAPDRVTVEL